MMGAMAAGRLALALLAYLALDFANPLMPGAVDFVQGTVPAVGAERARSTERVAMETPTPHDPPPPPVPSLALPGPPARAPLPRRPPRVPGRCRPRARSGPAPAADDH
jgi:hypothetical protein